MLITKCSPSTNKKAWANQGEKPFIYMWWTGWRAVDGLDRSWLQSIPDTTTAISLWGAMANNLPI